MLLLALTGCGRNMYEQARFEEDEPSTFFADGTSSRPLPEGTVSRSRGGIDEVFFTGQNADGLVTGFGTDLPWATRILLGTSKFSVDFWPFLLALAALCGWLFREARPA